MIGRYSKVQFALLFLCLFGCAQPKYETVVSSAPGQRSGDQSEDRSQGKAIDCSLHFKTSGLCINWNWEKMPTDSDMGSLVFKVFRANLLDGQPVDIDVASPPFVMLWMPDMGHGSIPITVDRVDMGTYRASNVFFIMPGKWEIRFQIKSGDVIQDEAIASVTI